VNPPRSPAITRGFFSSDEEGAVGSRLLSLADRRSVMLEEFARTMIYAETLPAGEVDKMLRKPGDVEALKPT